MDNQTQQLDPDAINLAKAIRQTESGGNPNASGASGEHGAYQFTQNTWNTLAPKYGVNTPLKQSTLEDQNKVAYGQIKEWKDQGMSPTAISSMWNSGKPDPTGNVGVNKFGVKFDTPAYVASVAKAYQTIKGGGNVAVDPNNPSSTSGTQMATLPNSNGATFQAGDNTGNTGNPIIDIGQGVGTDLLKMAGNVPSSAFNLGKNLFGAVMHPIKTAENIGGAAVGGLEKGYGAITGQNVQNDQTQKFDSVINGLKEKYGSLEGLRKYAVEDPVSLALDIATLTEGGGAALEGVGKLGHAGEIADLTEGLSGADKTSAIANAVNEGSLGKTAQIGQQVSDFGSKINPINIAGKGIGAVSKGVGKIASDTLGVATGTGGEAIRQGLKATSMGGDSYKAFLEGLRGNISPEDLVSQAQDALKEVVSNRNSSYQEMLGGLKDDPTIYNPTPIQDTLQKQLTNFGISETEKGLDFSRSKFALDKTAQGDITNLYELAKGWGSSNGDLSAVGIDKLKQIISSYYSPSSDYRSFTSALTKSARSVLENAPGYSDEMKNYADATEWINDTRKGLSLGDNAMTETSFKKLTTAFKQNNEWRTEALQELDKVTGGQLKAQIAGQQLSSFMPRGLAKFGTGIEAGAGVYSALTGGAGVIPLLATMAISSPKLVGEFLRGLGLTNQAVRVVMNSFKINPGMVANTTNVASKFNPPKSSFSR